MSFPLLNTRLNVPPGRAGLVDRPRLAAALQSAFDAGVRLILFAAPAGSGKSILAGQWANAARLNR